MPRISSRTCSPFLALWVLIAWVGGGCDSGKPTTRTVDGRVDPAAVYRLYCTGCHGDEGKRGQGTMVLARGQRPNVAEIRAVVENGRNEMPAWKQRLSPDEITAVVEFVRVLEEKARKR